MNKLGYQPIYERHLPHIQPPGATLFITFRLAGSVPARLMQEFLEEKRRVELVLGHVSDRKERASKANAERKHLFGKWDKLLESQNGPHWLGEEKIAALVAKAMHHRDKQVYDLIAFCILPNHVHLVVTPLEKGDGSYHSISAIMHSLKRRTARQANLLLLREGEFWQHENYDHVLRDKGELNRVVEYVLNNPVSAGLAKNREDWKWSYCKFL